jgi:hypothetical protein
MTGEMGEREGRRRRIVDSRNLMWNDVGMESGVPQMKGAKVEGRRKRSKEKRSKRAEK